MNKRDRKKLMMIKNELNMAWSLRRKATFNWRTAAFLLDHLVRMEEQEKEDKE